jgi:hypothetical protein
MHNRHGSAIEKRRALMQAWAAHVTGTVVPFNGAPDAPPSVGLGSGAHQRGRSTPTQRTD